MRKPKAVGLGAKMADDETRAIIYEGCSISQLATIFGLDNREVTRKINGLSPCGDRMGYPIYRLSEAATYLVPPPTGDIEGAIRKMRPQDLPPALTSEYWKGQHARLKFEEDQGDLWRTSDVLATLGEVFKTARMSILLMRDQVERNTTLSDRQRETLQTLIDNTLNDMADSLVNRFKNEPKRKFDAGWDEPEAPDSDAEDDAL